MIKINNLKRISGILSFILIYETTSLLTNNPALPSIKEIFNEFISIMANEETLIHIASSMKLIFLGILIAVIFGFTLGVIMSRYKTAMISLMPLIESLRGVAALTLFPLLIVTMGLGDSSRIFVIFWTSWPSVLIATIHGLETDNRLVEAAMDLGATSTQIMLRLRIPLAIPNIVNGIRIGISGGWISLIAAEMLGATKGIGYMLLWSSQAFNFKGVYAYIILIALLGGLMNLFMLKVERKVKEKFKS